MIRITSKWSAIRQTHSKTTEIEIHIYIFIDLNVIIITEMNWKLRH